MVACGIALISPAECEAAVAAPAGAG